LTGLKNRISLGIALASGCLLLSEIPLRYDWAWVVGVLGLADSLHLKLGWLEGRLGSLEASLTYLKGRVDGLNDNLSATREEVSALCATRSNKPT